MTKTYKIFTINPGSTSTKIAMFENDNRIFAVNVSHDAAELSKFAEISDQFDYRKETILSELAKQNITLDGTDAFVGRGGGLVGLEGGTYTVNDTLFNHAKIGFTIKHPATLGSQLARFFANQFGGIALVVNPPDVDELQLVARVTGIASVARESRGHPLNQKEIGIRYANSIGKKYEDLNLVISHIGGGVSVTAHQKGLMIDTNDVVDGDGPMAPTRAGSIPCKDIINMCFSGDYTKKQMMDLLTKNGGFVDHLGTSDAREVKAMMDSGNEYAKLIYDAMIYQIGKFIGAYAATMHGKVDAIILTGGIANDNYLTSQVTEMVSFIAPVKVMPGEFEMEALASGAYRVLSGQEQPKEYTGIPVFTGFKRD